jgi:hypothetical protein
MEEINGELLPVSQRLVAGIDLAGLPAIIRQAGEEAR